MISIHGKASKAQGGYSYVILLIGLVVLGIGAQTAHLLYSRIHKAELEKELLFRGLAYQQAIGDYYTFNKSYPGSLEALLKDPRHLTPRKYIRRLYPDPIGEEWMLIRNGSRGIVGVASNSEQSPLKQANFPPGLETFSGAGSYREWQFIYTPPSPNN